MANKLRRPWCIIFCGAAVGATLFFVATATQASDWTLVENENLEGGVKCSVYYDKDSITRPDASSASVWEREACPNIHREIKNWVRFGCLQRAITLKTTIVDGRQFNHEPWLNKPLGIEPGTSDEKLFAIICK